jgi:hypothetical protein
MAASSRSTSSALSRTRVSRISRSRCGPRVRPVPGRRDVVARSAVGGDAEGARRSRSGPLRPRWERFRGTTLPLRVTVKALAVQAQASVSYRHESSPRGCQIAEMLGLSRQRAGGSARGCCGMATRGPSLRLITAPKRPGQGRRPSVWRPADDPAWTKRGTSSPSDIFPTITIVRTAGRHSAPAVERVRSCGSPRWCASCARPPNAGKPCFASSPAIPRNLSQFAFSIGARRRVSRDRAAVDRAMPESPDQGPP